MNFAHFEVFQISNHGVVVALQLIVGRRITDYSTSKFEFELLRLLWVVGRDTDVHGISIRINAQQRSNKNRSKR